ncbi:hypothetical protein SAMN04489725_1162 [Alicyclobacillus hesperidum]|uniref:Uncharacterized protein n=1 Tax=Alicyclobacillus hesperidum TaxID=89784 RepID=A0A1H2WMX6_9BACL|nr:hypothetical protein [Alicyclobacillus hesperidum]SDW81905.1 hypothetical protein SAMN04489725_1162 [Alicyclobacillus hesperidum]
MGELQSTLFEVGEGNISPRTVVRRKEADLPLHHFWCRRDDEWRVLHAMGEIFGVMCPVCGRLMKEVKIIQLELDI